MNTLTQALAGERVRMTLTVRGKRATKTVTVGAYHPSTPSNEIGHWLCVTHDQHFDNQFQKDTHINEGTHHLAWICHEHGIEQPTAQATAEVPR